MTATSREPDRDRAREIAERGLIRAGRAISTSSSTACASGAARSALREVRAGEVRLEEVLRRLDAATAELEEAAHDPGLPARSDVATVDAFLVSAYRRAWDEGLTA